MGLSRIKALLCRAFFMPVVLPFSLFFPGVAGAGCERYIDDRPIEVTYIYDGDTLRLADGRKVRLIGINTPEMGRDGQADDPGAKAASRQLEELLEASDRLVHLLTGSEKRDRYKRLLAHVYDQKGESITEQLLRMGAGYAVVIPPNLKNLDCYQLAESRARKQRRGVWKSHRHTLDSLRMRGDEAGFHLIRGQIERVGSSRKSLWLNLKDAPAIRIDWSDWDYFPKWVPDNLLGRRLEVRGWIYHSKGQQRMRIHHPAAIRWLD